MARHPDGEDATPTAGPAPSRVTAPPRSGTGSWAREQLAEADEERREMIARALEAQEERAKSAERTQRMMLWAGGATILTLVVLVALLLGRQFHFAGFGADVSTGGGAPVSAHPPAGASPAPAGAPAAPGEP